jgi:ABC-type multidrug transport system ATPase subunit
MRRRLDLGATLTGRPPVILLDEPTTGLDPRTRQELWNTVEELRRDGTTVLLTTQYLEEADRLAQRIAVVDRGVYWSISESGCSHRRVAGMRVAEPSRAGR